MRTTHRGAVAIISPVLARTEQLPNILFSELYRLNADPYKLENSYRTVDPASIAKLDDQLGALRSCATATYREAEDAP